MFAFTLFAETPNVPVPPTGGLGGLFMPIMLIGMLGLMFFMQSRAKKQAAQRDAFRSTLAIGQRVMTQGGLVGTIVGINQATDSVILDSAGSRCEYMRAGIAKTLDDVADVSAVTTDGAGVAVATAAASAPAQGGILAKALSNAAGVTETGPVVSDDDLAELDNIAQEYHATPVVVVEEE